MYRAIPEVNRLTHQRMVKSNQRVHHRQVRSVQPLVDNNKPNSMGYPIIKLKKEQLIEERCVEIERDNRILLERMTKILAGPQTKSQAVNFKANASNMPSIMQGSLSQYPHLKSRGKACVKSLNMGARLQTERRIMEENERMLGRLQDQGSHYNVYDWELDRKEGVKRVKAICYYPPSMTKEKKKKTRRSNRTAGRMVSGEEPNRKLFDMYQDGIRQSHELFQDASKGSGEFSVEQPMPQEYVNNETRLPSVQRNMDQNYQTHNTRLFERHTKKPSVASDEQRLNTNRLAQEDRMQLKSEDQHARPPFTSGNDTKGTFASVPSKPQTQHTNQQPVMQQNLMAKPGVLPSLNMNIVAKKRPPPMQIGWNDMGISTDRQVLYRNFHDISGKIFLVEISRTTKKVFFLLFPNFERAKQFLWEGMTEKQAMKLMADSDNSFENMVKRLYIKFGRLQIDGVHGKEQRYRAGKSVSPFAQREQSHIENQKLYDNEYSGFSVHKSKIMKDSSSSHAENVVSHSTQNFQQVQSNIVAGHTYGGSTTENTRAMPSENQYQPESYPMSATDTGLNSGAIVVEQTNSPNPMAYNHEGGQLEHQETAAFQSMPDRQGVGSEDLPGQDDREPETFVDVERFDYEKKPQSQPSAMSQQDIGERRGARSRGGNNPQHYQSSSPIPKDDLPTEATRAQIASGGQIVASYSQHNEMNIESHTNPLTGANTSAFCRSNNNTEDIEKTYEAHMHRSQENTALSKSSETQPTLIGRGGASVLQHSTEQIKIQTESGASVAESDSRQQ